MSVHLSSLVEHEVPTFCFKPLIYWYSTQPSLKPVFKQCILSYKGKYTRLSNDPKYRHFQQSLHFKALHIFYTRSYSFGGPLDPTNSRSVSMRVKVFSFLADA